MRKLLVSLAVIVSFFVPSICMAGIADYPKVAVLPFVDQTARHVSEDTLDKVYNFVNEEMSFSQRFQMVTRNADDIKRVLDEMQFQRSGLTDPNTAVRVGKFLGAQYIVLGSITGFSSNSNGKGKYIGHVSMRVIEVETAAIALAGRGTGTGDNDYDVLENTVMDAMDGKRGILTLLKGGKR